MAVIFLTGFDGRLIELDQDGSVARHVVLSGTAAISTVQHRTGPAALRCNPASGAAGYMQLQAPSTKGWVHFGLYIATMPSVARVICGASGSGSNVKLNSTGKLEAFDGSTTRGTTTTTLTTGVWYWIGWRAAAGTTVPLIQIAGTTEVTGTVAVAPNTNIGLSGTEASAADIYIDDVIVDGAGFLGPSNVGLLLPISDNGTHTGWQAGNGGTTNLWQGVDNVPPAGLASASETNTSNIESIASTGGTYTANLQTYTTGGVGASDTVIAVQSLIRHGEDIITGTKTGTVGAATNPTITGVGITFGSDLGAHGADPGSTFWVTAPGTLTTSPSVTLGTSPTLAVVRPNEARVGCIDFMGLLVAWTPAAGGPATSLPTAGALVLTGATPTVTATANVFPAPTAGAMTLTGSVPAVAIGVNPQPTAGAMTLTGAVPTVTAIGTSHPLPTAGALVLTGSVPTVTAIGTSHPQPTAGALTLAGSVPTVVAIGTSSPQPTAAAMTLAGSVPAVVTPVVTQPTAGALVLTGAVPAVFVSGGANVTVLPTAGALVLTGSVPAVAATINQAPWPSAGVLSLTGSVPAVLTPVVSQPTAVAMTLTGAVPTVTAIGTAVALPGAASMTLAGTVPSVNVSGGAVNPQPPAVSLVLAGAIPVVTATGGTVNPQPTAGAMTLAGAVPVVTAIGTSHPQPTAGAMTLAGAVPTVSTSASVVAVPGPASAVLTGAVPAVTRTLNVVAYPTAASLAMTGFAPNLVISDLKQAQPTPAAMVLTAAVPFVFVTGARTEWIPDSGYATAAFLTGSAASGMVPGVTVSGIDAGRTFDEIPGAGVAGAGQPSKGA
jgi:hypothetical protein